MFPQHARGWTPTDGLSGHAALVLHTRGTALGASRPIPHLSTP